jgi:hypothetical protein
MPTPAEKARDEAIARVGRSLTKDELVDALVAVGHTAKRMSEFTTDDVPFELPADVEPRAIGYVMTRAAREGFIERTDRTVKSTQVQCHARDKRVWRSLLAP